MPLKSTKLLETAF